MARQHKHGQPVPWWFHHNSVLQNAYLNVKRRDGRPFRVRARDLKPRSRQCIQCHKFLAPTKHNDDEYEVGPARLERWAWCYICMANEKLDL